MCWGENGIENTNITVCAVLHSVQTNRKMGLWIRIWKTTPVTTPRQRPIHTNPRAATPATSPISAAPLDTPHSALAAGVDTPQPTALGNCQLRVSRACQWPRSQSRPKLKLQQQRAVVYHNAMAVTRIKSLRTPSKIGLRPEVNGWLG